MSHQQKREFIDEVLSHLKTRFEQDLSKMPRYWQGSELTLYLSDRLSELASHRLSPARRRNYIADCQHFGI